MMGKAEQSSSVHDHGSLRMSRKQGEPGVPARPSIQRPALSDLGHKTNLSLKSSTVFPKLHELENKPSEHEPGG